MKLSRIFLLALGTVFILYGLASPAFRDSTGSLQSQFLFPCAFGVACLLIGLTHGGALRKSGLWFALAIVGQAASLQLIFAGKAIHYQHYRSLSELISTQYVIYVLVIIIQICLVIIGISKHWRSIHKWLAGNSHGWQILIVGLVFVFSSAAFSRVYTDYFLEVFWASLLQFTNLATVLLVLLSLPDDGLNILNKTFKNILNSSDYVFIIASCVIVFVLTASLSYFIYQKHPHLQDEVLYLYQATYFSQGKLTVPAPSVPEAFTIYMIPYKENDWYAPFPPGWASLLALGVLIKAPWLVNPLLSSINILLAYILFNFLFTKSLSRLAILLLCASPWFIFMGMSFMSHTFMLTCALAASVSILMLWRKQKLVWAAIAAISVGILSLIRPLDALVMGFVIGLPLLFINPKRLRFSSVAIYLLSAMVVGGLNLLYNQAITGDPLKFPLNRYYETYYGPNTYALGFGPDRGIDWPIDPLPGYSPLEAVINAGLNMHSVNTELLGWSSGSLFFVLVAVFWGYRRLKKIDYLMLASVFLIALFYALFWFSGGPDFGARYWYLMIVPLIYLSVRGIAIIQQKMPGQTKNKVYIFALALCLLTIINYLPWRSIDKYYRYLGMRPDIRSTISIGKFNNSLVFIQGQSHPDFESAWTYNPIDLSTAAPIFAFDKDNGVRVRVLAAYPDRPVWILAGPTVTGGAYQIIAGPLTNLEAETYK